MRSLWNGALRFGLVTIPVKLYAATEDRAVKAHQLHDYCRTPVRYQKYCPTCERALEAGEVVRGYEVAPGRYVVEEELSVPGVEDGGPGPNAKAVEIIDFVPQPELDPVYYDKTYLMEPGEGGGKAYALLLRALKETGRVGVGRFTLRSRAALCAVRPIGRLALALVAMHDPDEVRSAEDLQFLADPDGVDERELEMARQLVASMAEPFDPARYPNVEREALRQRLAERAVAAQPAAAPVHAGVEPALAGEAVDLMEALRRSLEQAGRPPAQQ